MTRILVDRQAADPTRDRTVFLNQFLLSAAAIVGLVLVLVLRSYADLGLLIAGGAIAFIATGAALVVPWNRLPAAIMAVIPASDIAAIALLREGAPNGSFGLLWVFPAMWAAWEFGRIGTAASVAVITAVYWILAALSPERVVAGSLLLLPATIAAAATISYFMARRARGQRGLLERQSTALRQAVERAREQEERLAELLSRELREPLASLAARLDDALADPSLGDGSRQRIEAAREDAQHAIDEVTGALTGFDSTPRESMDGASHGS